MTPEEQIAELRRVGDQMQSTLSRLLEYISDYVGDVVYSDDYEAGMATLEGANAIEDWTAIRSSGA